MNIVRYIFAIPVGAFIGSLVNIGLLLLLSKIISFPEGMDFMDPESIKAAIPEFGIQHYAVPFIAHAGGTLIGAWIAALIAPDYKMVFALIIGAFFLVGGIMNTAAIPAPMTYNVIDILICYLPMAWLGYRLALNKKA